MCLIRNFFNFVNQLIRVKTIHNNGHPMTKQTRAHYEAPLLEDLRLHLRVPHLLSELSLESGDNADATIDIIQDQGEL